MAKKLTLDLSVFKSSGVYTLEFDASENIIVNPQTIRLVVGFSTKGPFNTPVYVPDQQTALKVFGDIDRALEKKGSFFHRSMFTCLNSGPIFALNLLKLNNSVVEESGDPDVARGADVARYRAFSLDTAELNGDNPTSAYTTNNDLLPNQDRLVSSYYNKEKFWFPDPKSLLATVHNNVSERSKLFSMVNLSQKEVSLVIRKSLDSRIPIRGFDITAKEYFGANNVPNFMHPEDYISDYFVDVIAISGNWTKYSELSLDPIYSGYFTPKGFVKHKIDDFLGLSEVNVIFSVTGSLIPDFVDQNGVARYIKTLINTQVGETGILCAINEEALDDLSSGEYSYLDLVGHHLTGALNPANPAIETIDFLSYSSPFTSDFTYTQNEMGLLDSNSPSHELIEGGSFYKEVLYPGTYGVESADFAIYDYTHLDPSYQLPYIQTNFTGVTKSDRINDLKNYLSTTVTSPEPKYILGKVTGDIMGNVEACKSFANDDLVKLKIEGIDLRTVSTGNVQLRIIWSHPLFTMNHEYVEPYDAVTLTNGNYQFGKADYFDKIDPIEYGMGALGSPIMLSPQELGNYDYFCYSESMLYLDYKNGLVSDGDVIHKAYDASDVQYVKFEESVDRDGFKTLTMKTYVDDAFTTIEAAIGLGMSYKSGSTGPLDTVDSDKLNIISIVGNLNEYVDLMSIISTNQIEMSVTDADNAGLKVGDLLVSTDLDLFPNASDIRNNRLTRIVEVKKVAVPGSPGNYTIYVKTDRPILVFAGATPRVNKFKPIHQFIDNFKFSYLPGFQIKAAHKPNGSDDRIDEILDVLFETNIASTLSDRNIITFRYIVDTFDGQIKTNSKSQLSRLAKLRQKCLALLNAPSISRFKDSIDPKFTDAPTAVNPAPLLNAKYIADGGNLSLNPSFRFSLPDEDLGAKFCGMFSPFLTIRENGKNLNVPPAASVSNNFIRKFVTGEPYAIVAGQKRGILSGSNLVGLEYDFSQDDRDYLEPFGINPIIRKRNIGLVIYGNQTGYQRTNSAFNNLHVRDLLITLEEAVEDILANYVFDFNEDSVRLEIKTIVDNYLSGVKNVGGIYNFLSIMDSSNNTPAIIDQNIGIIDIIIEPARGIHKFINRMTVTRTGGISSGGFFQFV
jgi:hypothetical protein